MYRIRFHGRGGQGIKTAANILGSAFFGEGFEVQDAPRYGAERRGAPIFAYVRAARTTIHERGVIAHPGLVAAADESLVTLPAAGVLQGITARTVLLISTEQSTQTWKERLRFPGTVLVLPPPQAASPRAGMPQHSAVCAGAAARLAGVIRRETLVNAVCHELAVHSKEIIERNLRCALSAYDAMAGFSGVVTEDAGTGANVPAAPGWIDMPRDEVRIAAPDIRAAASSEQSLTGAWRTFRPVIDHEHCNRCSWICGTLCPDSAIRIDADHTPHIDYQHCKGCLVCVAVCPPHAIRAAPEGEAAEREAAAP
jgi:pyruvate ferredoxin oxidoreductase gamma subunit